MATAELEVTSVIVATGWTGATVANLNTSNDARATNGEATELISCEIDNAPGGFTSMNNVTLHFEARNQGTISREQRVTIELRNSSETILETHGPIAVTSSDVVYNSSARTRSDSSTVIDGWRLRVTITEGGGMAEDETVEIDHMWVTLDYNAGADHALLADDLESATEVSTPAVGQTHGLLADDLESAVEVSTPAVGQLHALLADDLESAAEVSTPSVGQLHALLADDVEVVVEVSSPALAIIHNLLADDLETATELSTPTIAQLHVLLADDVESVVELSTPAIAQLHILLADDLEVVAEISSPTLTENTADHNLLADDLESATEVSTPAITQLHVLLADDLQSLTEVSTPALVDNEAVANISQRPVILRRRRG